MATPSKCIMVIGPTATGKTALGVGLARHFRGEIVSADSRQVYRGMDIGTGKDLIDYTAGGQTVPHHLINIASPHETYNLHRFLQDAHAAIDALRARDHLPIIVGGTPLYVKALLEGYELAGGEPDPQYRASLADLSTDTLIERLRQLAPERLDQTDISQRKRVIRALEIVHTQAGAAVPAPRPSIVPLILAPFYPRPVVHERIARRLDQRLAGGMVEEVQQLHATGVTWQRLDDFGLEYRYIARHLQGHLSATAMRDALLARIRRFCKAQDIWYRRFERDGHDIHWIPEGDLAVAIQLVTTFLAGAPMPEPAIRMKDRRYGPRSDR